MVGDTQTSTNGKAPAVSWKRYQKRAPSMGQVHEWFGSDTRTAYGIICGTVSKLLVVDIDDPAWYLHLREHVPQLLDTMTVRTGGRGGWHLYYRLDFHAPSRAFDGLDLKGERAYVVGPGSRIEGRTWTLTSGETAPQHLNRETYRALLEAIEAYLSAQNGPKSAVNAPNDLTQADAIPAPENGPQLLLDLVSLYRRRVEKTGLRNTSLFEITCLARDAGHTHAEVECTLSHVHAVEHPRMGQVQERYELRYKEARATIASAFKRPARPVRHTHNQEKPAVAPSVTEDNEPPRCQLNNHVRETILQRPEGDGAAILRTLEALALSGIKHEERLSAGKIRALLRGLVGEHSVNRALKALNPAGEPLFRIVLFANHKTSPSNPPHAEAVRVEADPAGARPNAIGSGSQNRITDPNEAILDKSRNVYENSDKNLINDKYSKNQKRYYCLPSCAEVARWAGHTETLPGDPITSDDLRSRKTYRQALHHGLLKRRPGSYTLRLLGDRLGVSDHTIRRYHREMNVQSYVNIQREEVYWRTVRQIPHQQTYERYHIPRWGRFLQIIDASGAPEAQLYPPFQEVAVCLLQKLRQRPNAKLMLCYQGPSFYWLAGTEPPPEVLERQAKPVQPAPTIPETPETSQKGAFKPLKVSADTTSPPPVKQTPPPVPQPDEPPREQLILRPTPGPAEQKPSFRKPLPDETEEIFAQALVAAIEGLKAPTARRLVWDIGPDKLLNVLKRVLHLHQNGHVQHLKAYFLAAAGRAAAQQTSPTRATTPHADSPRFYRQPLPDETDENAAQQAHHHLPELNIFNARRLVATYGAAIVQQTLADFRTHLNRNETDIWRPVGLFITLLRARWRKTHPDALPGQTPTFQGQPKRRPRSRPYDLLAELRRMMQSDSWRDWLIDFLQGRDVDAGPPEPPGEMPY